jgi:hypothetical protein
VSSSSPIRSSQSKSSSTETSSLEVISNQAALAAITNNSPLVTKSLGLNLGLALIIHCSRAVFATLACQPVVSLKDGVVAVTISIHCPFRIIARASALVVLSIGLNVLLAAIKLLFNAVSTTLQTQEFGFVEETSLKDHRQVKLSAYVASFKAIIIAATSCLKALSANL